MENNTQAYVPSLEYRARHPRLDEIRSEVLSFREKNGVAKTLEFATEHADYVPSARLLSKELISSCNFSGALCRKALKSRGVSSTPVKRGR